MSIVLENRKLTEDFYLLKVKEPNQAVKGQFYMLRAWEHFPVLSRPISVFDADEESVSFLYKVVGQGTEIFTGLVSGDEIQMTGPHGNGFPEQLSGRIALVGGGVGIAPLYLAARQYRRQPAVTNIDLYLGFSGEELLHDEYQAVADRLTVNVGGFITDEIDPREYDYILTCGPEIMMRVLYQKCQDTGADAPLYVSMENRMGCGIGACVVCTCKTKSGNRKVCKDGPVFLGSEVFG